MGSEDETSTERVKRIAKEVSKHEPTNLFTRGLIGLGVAYVCWASSRLVTQLDKDTQAIGNLGRQVERSAVISESTSRAVSRIERNQQEIRSKVEDHIRIPAHPVAASMHKRISDDIREIKDELKRKR